MRSRPIVTIVAVVLAAGCGDSQTASRTRRPAAAPVQQTPSLAVVRTSTAPRRGYPRYDIVIVRRGRTLRVIAGDSLGRRVRPVEFGRVSWAPDGRRLAFAADLRHSGGFRTDIYTVRADGSDQRRLTRTGDAFEPVWSPGGKLIVFSRRGRLRNSKVPYFTSTLWAMHADGSDGRRLTHSGEQVAELGGSFSPDGESFLFNRAVFDDSGEPDKSASGLFLMDADGSEERRLVADGSEPAVSPDGRRIAFITARDRNGELNYGDQVTPAGELYVMRADGTHLRRLTRTRDLNEANPSWLPNGKRLAYQRGKVIANAEGMVVMQINPDGSCARPLLADPRLDTWYNDPAWRPGVVRHDAGRLRCPAARPRQVLTSE